MLEELNKIRKEIDKIDDKLLALLQERLGHVNQVAKVKAANQSEFSFIKPDREADMMRSLAARGGELPRAFILQMWRLMIAMSLQKEKNFKIHALRASEKLIAEVVGYYSLYTEIIWYDDNQEMLTQIIKNPDDVLVLDIKTELNQKFLLDNQDYKVFSYPNIFTGELTMQDIPDNFLVARILPNSLKLEKIIVAIAKDQLALLQNKHINIAELTHVGADWQIILLDEQGFSELKTAADDIKYVLLGSYA